jgi:outer membrane protein
MAIACISFRANAQTFKFGHINSSEIWTGWTEIDSVKTKVEQYRKELVEVLEGVAVEYEKKLAEFQDNQDKWSDVVKESKQGELLDMNKRIQNQQQNAQIRLQEREQKLFEPVQKKFKDAVDKVAKANNFTYIFDISAGNPLYFNETQSTDIGALVKKELGITK